MVTEPDEKRICRCECGGWVRGVARERAHYSGRHFWTYCDRCTPVQTVSLKSE